MLTTGLLARLLAYSLDRLALNQVQDAVEDRSSSVEPNYCSATMFECMDMNMDFYLQDSCNDPHDKLSQ